MNDEVINKLCYVKRELSKELMLLNEGNKLKPISDYQYFYKVSRGTVQNAISELENEGAIKLDTKGRNGSIIKKIDYVKLQHNFISGAIIGALTMPYQIVTQALVTALNVLLENSECELIYARKARTRLEMVSFGKCQFAVCSLYSAKIYMKEFNNLKILFNFGPYTYMSEHILLFADDVPHEIQPGMKIGYDPSSLDNKDIIDFVTSDIKDIQLVPIQAHKTIEYIKAKKIDVGLGVLEEAKESELQYSKINSDFILDFTTAVLIINKKDSFTEGLLTKYIDTSELIRLQYCVKNGTIPVKY